MRQTFVVRIKPGGEDRVLEALASGMLILGWSDLPEAINLSKNREGLRDAMEAWYGRGRHSAANQARSLSNFVVAMKIGDLALVPHKRRHFYIGVVEGDAFLDATPGASGIKRKVRWLNNGHFFEKKLYEPIFDGLKDRTTCYKVSTKQRPAIGEFIDQVMSEAELAEDIAEIGTDRKISATTRAALIDARLGQQGFRDQLLARWGGACAVTGSKVLSAIRASHVKPWRACSNEERLNADNGLPLLATIDALFDRGLVTFDCTGKMLISPQIERVEYAALGIPADLRERPNSALQGFLEHHRTQFEADHRSDVMGKLDGRRFDG